MLETLWIITVSVMLVAIIVVLLLMLVSAVFHLRQMVAFVPTPRVIAEAMVDLASLKPGDKVYDLGAGDGRVLEHALRREPRITAVGIEGAYGVWLLGKIRGFFLKQKPVLVCTNFFGSDLKDADVIFAYLGVDMMQRLRPKLESELRPGTRVVSHAFSVHGWEPAEVKSIVMPFFGKTNVYLYRR
jgi:hypothetical protein